MVNSKVKEIASLFNSTRRTNINNINNINNIIYDNNINNINDCTWGSNPGDKTTSLSDLAETSSQQNTEGQVDSSCLGQVESSVVLAPKIGVLPDNWRSVKFDLFQNGTSRRGRPKLTLRMGVITRNSTEPVQLTAQMNSPVRHMYRKVSEDDLQNAHWTLVKEYDGQFRTPATRASKFYINQKSGSVENLVAWLSPQGDDWCVDLIRDGEVYQFKIDKTGTPAFRNRGGLKTAYYSSSSTTNGWVSLKDLGL